MSTYDTTSNGDEIEVDTDNGADVALAALEEDNSDEAVCSTWQDDVVIFSKSLEEHVEHL